MTVAPEPTEEAPKGEEPKPEEEPKTPEPKAEGQPKPGAETAEQKAARLEAENQRLSRKIADKDKADRKAEQDRLKEAGNHEEAAKLAQKDADEARDELAKERRTNRGLRIAGELKFNNPSNALRLIDAEDLDDDDKAKKALTQLAKDEPGLLAEAVRRRSAPIDGGSGNSTNADMNELLRRGFGRGG